MAKHNVDTSSHLTNKKYYLLYISISTHLVATKLDRNMVAYDKKPQT